VGGLVGIVCGFLRLYALWLLYWLASIIDFDRFAPLADTENAILRTTRLKLSQRKALANLKIDANAATLL